MAGKYYLKEDTNTVGPFDTAEEANDWMDENGFDTPYELYFEDEA